MIEVLFIGTSDAGMGPRGIEAANETPAAVISQEKGGGK